MIHNHPSGVLRASEADMYLANRYGEDGVEVIIVNNNVDDDFWVVEPHKDTAERLDPAEVQAFFEQSLPRVMPNFEARICLKLTWHWLLPTPSITMRLRYSKQEREQVNHWHI